MLLTLFLIQMLGIWDCFSNFLIFFFIYVSFLHTFTTFYNIYPTLCLKSSIKISISAIKFRNPKSILILSPARPAIFFFLSFTRHLHF